MLLAWLRETAHSSQYQSNGSDPEATLSQKKSTGTSFVIQHTKWTVSTRYFGARVIEHNHDYQSRFRRL